MHNGRISNTDRDKVNTETTSRHADMWHVGG